MSSPDDSRDVTDRLLDAHTMDRLLAGAIHPDDAPPGFGDVAALIRRLLAPPSERELAASSTSVSAAASILAMRPHPRGSRDPLRALSLNGHRRFLKAKVASLVVVGTLVGGTGMAVAGVLPAPIQDAASTVFANVGISIPNSGTSVHHPASSGEDISKIATTTTKTGVQKGAEISSTASGGMSHAGEDTGANGSSGASAGGTQTGDQASGGRNSTGVDHSSVGAGNGTQDPAGDGPGATPAGNAP